MYYGNTLSYGIRNKYARPLYRPGVSSGLSYAEHTTRYITKPWALYKVEMQPYLNSCGKVSYVSPKQKTVYFDKD